MNNIKATQHFRMIKQRINLMSVAGVNDALCHYLGADAAQPIIDVLGRGRGPYEVNDYYARGMVAGLCLARAKAAREKLMRCRDVLADYYLQGLLLTEGDDARDG